MSFSLSRFSIWVYRTNSDCCPDYFTHCEGLTLPSPPLELTRPDGPYVPQEAEPPVTILPPTGCEFGLLNISSVKTCHVIF